MNEKNNYIINLLLIYFLFDFKGFLFYFIYEFSYLIINIKVLYGKNTGD